MGKIMVLDTECNSLDTSSGFIQELAWAIYDMDSQRLLKCRSHLLHWNMAYTVEPGAFDTTGLSRDFCESNGLKAMDVFMDFLTDCEAVDCICGHNLIDYDKKMLVTNIKRCMFDYPSRFESLFTFDTYYDCPYPKSQKIFALKYLALDHGHILSGAHQAMADVFACAHIFFKYKFEECFRIASTPLVTLSGFTQFMDQAGRDAFYSSKFRFNKDKKRWEKRCRAIYIKEAQLTLGNRDLFCDDKRVIIAPEAQPSLFEQGPSL